MTDQEKTSQRQLIAELIEETYLDMHYMPVESALIPDYFLRYWDLAEAVCAYFDVPFRKPRLTSPDEVK